MSWSNENLACVNTWGVLAALQQHEEAFADFGEIFVSGLFFWNPLDSKQMREQKARSLSSQLDKVFRLVFEAKYANGADGTKAIDSMKAVLTDEDKKAVDLAATIDGIYTFLDEIV